MRRLMHSGRGVQQRLAAGFDHEDVVTVQELQARVARMRGLRAAALAEAQVMRTELRELRRIHRGAEACETTTELQRVLAAAAGAREHAEALAVLLHEMVRPRRLGEGHAVVQVAVLA